MMTNEDANELTTMGKVITSNVAFTKKRPKKIAVSTIQESMKNK